MSFAASGANVYSIKRMKQKLKEKYGDSIFFAEVPGRPNIVCLKDMAAHVIVDSWYKDRKSNIDQESERIIATAAKLIKFEIREKQYQCDYYPDNTDIKDLNYGKEWLPRPLLLFLQHLILSETKQVSIGQCIVKANRPLSSIPPLLFGLGVEMDHVFGSKWLIDELYRLGFSVSSTEVTRYKQSVIQSQDINSFIPGPFPGTFTQWVGDNVDHNIATLDGSGTFHGMGVIAVSTQTGVFKSIPSVDRVKRLRLIKAKSLIGNHGIPIKPYVAPAVRGLSHLRYKPVLELQWPFILPPTLHIDTLWHAGWMFRDASQPRPNWAGFMQSVSVGCHPHKSDILMLPIIDLNPNDTTCIYSTLLFIQEQAINLNVVTPCITFDQPLWIKAVDIIRSESLDIVCRLGGFHLMMSFLGSIGTFMDGSGITQALERVYGPNAVAHMMTGKAVARAVRGHLLLDSALMVKLMRMICPVIDLRQHYSNTTSCNIDVDDRQHDDTSCDVDEYDHLLEGVDEDTAYIGLEDDNEVSLDLPISNSNVVIPQLEESELKEIGSLFQDVIEKKREVGDIAESSVLSKFENTLEECKLKLACISRTAKLWLQYMAYVEILRLFIRAERTGDWHLHLVAVSKMLNIFAATGHNNYAKSSRLYLQMMLDLPSEYPWLYEQFAIHGFHTVRRADRYWAGLWTDLIIEQVMMRSIKSRGGLTRGRGMTESVRLCWVYSMHKCAAIHHSMTELTKCYHKTSDQHVELGGSRCLRDFNDVQKMVNWLDAHEPFDFNEVNLRCLSSGLTSIAGDGINCDNVEEVGAGIQKSMDCLNVLDVSMKRSNQVKTLVNLEKCITVEKQPLHIDGNVLFSRLIVLIQRTDNIAPYFDYELTPVPMALFKDWSMRKTNKSVLANYLLSTVNPITQSSGSYYVLDGGALLHRVRWAKNATYADILRQYVLYVTNKYGKCCVVFDGYSCPSTKDHEHHRRGSRSSSYIRIEEHMSVDVDQELLLANDENKKQFICLLKNRLSLVGHDVHQASNDADTLIASKALELASSGRLVSVIADDTDILVLLIHHYQPNMADIHFVSELRNKKETKVYSINNLVKAVGYCVAKHIPFIHAWSGCDTTSATFGHGKTNLLKKLKRCPEVREIGDTFYCQRSSQEEIMKAGNRLFVLMYGGKKQETLGSLRYRHFMQMAAKGTVLIQAHKLPPTERSAYFHCLRVHLQVIQWASLDVDVANPIDWGWKLDNASLLPIMTDKAVAPDDVLNVVRCNCKTSSRNTCGSNQCSCRKHGLHCVSVCGDCHGKDCNNILPPTHEDVEDDTCM